MRTTWNTLASVSLAASLAAGALLESRADSGQVVEPGVDSRHVRVVYGQTDRIAYGIGAHASRASVMTGSATHAATLTIVFSCANARTVHFRGSGTVVPVQCTAVNARAAIV